MSNQWFNNALWAVPPIAGPRAIHEASKALYTPGRRAPAKGGGVQFSPEMQGIIKASTGSKPSAVFNAPTAVGGGVALSPEAQGVINTALGSMSPLFNRPGVGPKPPRQPVPATLSSAPPQVVPGQAITPGPGLGAPTPVVSSGAQARASELNARYQQAGGRDSYWEANPAIKAAAESGPRAGTVGYSDRADIQAWIKAQGGTSNPMVQKFLADQERRGLVRKPEGAGVTAFGAAAGQATAAGLSPEQLAAGGAYSKGAEALPGGTSLQKESEQAAWAREDQALKAESAFGTDASVPAVALGGASGLSNAPNGPVDLRQAQAQAPWAGGNQAEGFAAGVGNFHTSEQVRGMNLAGDQALGSAKANQLLATRPDPDAATAEPDAPPALRPQDKLLDEYMRGLTGGYRNSVIQGLW